MPASRRLAAILAADVAGYSRLVGIDEEGTLARLRGLRRELIDPEIQAHNGRIVKTTGDGILIEFASVVDAVRCAIALQGGMTLRNSDVPQERRIIFRVGINLGDIVVEGDDILGDGVNIEQMPSRRLFSFFKDGLDLESRQWAKMSQPRTASRKREMSSAGPDTIKSVQHQFGISNFPLKIEFNIELPIMDK